MASAKKHHGISEDPMAFRIDSGAHNHYVDSELLPIIKKVRDENLPDPPMRVNTFQVQVLLRTKSGILQISTRTKDGKMLLGMSVILAPGSDGRSLSITRAAKNGLYPHIESKV